MGYNGNNHQCNKCPAGRNTDRPSNNLQGNSVCNGVSIVDWENGVRNCEWDQSDIDDCIFESGKPTSTTDWGESYSQQCSYA